MTLYTGNVDYKRLFAARRIIEEYIDALWSQASVKQDESGDNLILDCKSASGKKLYFIIPLKRIDNTEFKRFIEAQTRLQVEMLSRSGYLLSPHEVTNEVV